MRDEYDFTKGERGRFFREGATLSIPIHLESDILVSLRERAESQGVSLGTLVNGLLRQTIAASAPANSVGHADS